MDEIDRNLILALQLDSASGLAELSKAAGLSVSATAERVKRLEERGVIRQYTVEIDPQALGFTLQAMVRVRPMPGKLHIVQRLLEEIPEIGECDKVTGEDCFIARLYVRSIDQLDHILDRVADHAETNTAIVKTQPVRRRPPPLAVK